MLTVVQASAAILADIGRQPTERVSLLDSLGRVLANPVASPISLPPWDNSAMDGYAVRGADVEHAASEHPVRLRVIESVAAGAFPALTVTAGSATRIMTGAPVPGGADTVIRVEDTDDGREHVVIRDGRDAFRNVRPRGEDVRAGTVVCQSGTTVKPADVGILAAIGCAEVEVYRLPRVAILGSGDELVPIEQFEEVRAGRRIVSSNNYALHALVRAAGGIPIDLGIAPDDPAALADHVKRADGCDLLLTTAGVSVGEFDYTRQALERLGASMKFWKVRMRPGAPLAFGSVSGMPWIGLPGNPVSTMVTFELFVRPAIRKMLGHQHLFRRTVPVILEESVVTGPRLTHFLRAVVHLDSDRVARARLTGPQGSSILSSMSLANALLVVPEDQPRTEAGETLNALLLGDDIGASEYLVL